MKTSKTRYMLHDIKSIRATPLYRTAVNAATPRTQPGDSGGSGGDGPLRLSIATAAPEQEGGPATIILRAILLALELV